MCRWKQHFSVNLETLSSAAFGACENPQGPENKWLDLQAAGKITSLSASLFPRVTLHSCVDRILKRAVRENRKKCTFTTRSLNLFSFLHRLYEWHPSEETHLAFLQEFRRTQEHEASCYGNDVVQNMFHSFMFIGGKTHQRFLVRCCNRVSISFNQGFQG